MLKEIPDALRFNPEAYKHGKAIALAAKESSWSRKRRPVSCSPVTMRRNRASRSRTTRTVSLSTLPKRLLTTDSIIYGSTKSWRSSFPIVFELRATRHLSLTIELTSCQLGFTGQVQSGDALGGAVSVSNLRTSLPV
jgi:hypothetical protein